jgi:phytoene synthase
LPRADAERVSCNPDLTGPASEVARLVEFECGRAEKWFAEGLQLLPLLDGRSRACVSAMSGIYWRLLRRIEREPFAVTQGRVSIPTWEKLSVAVRSLVEAR